MQPIEEWREIPGFEGYEASSFGRIRSIERSVATKRGIWHYHGKILAVSQKQSGHLSTGLGIVNGKQRRLQIHQAVMLAFVGPAPENKMVAHNDGDPTNNNVDNLRYDTLSGNYLDKHRHGTMVRGADFRWTKLTESQVTEIRQSKLSIKELMQKYKMSRSHLCALKSGKFWRWLK